MIFGNTHIQTLIFLLSHDCFYKDGASKEIYHFESETLVFSLSLWSLFVFVLRLFRLVSSSCARRARQQNTTHESHEHSCLKNGVLVGWS